MIVADLILNSLFITLWLATLIAATYYFYLDWGYWALLIPIGAISFIFILFKYGDKEI